MFKNKSKYPYMIITTILILTAFLLWDTAKAQSANKYLENQNYSLQIGYEELYKTTRADVVMLGDSHTYNINWDELLGRNGIINRGINSDITQGYLHRLNYVYKLNPKICFIEGGINDIYSGFTVKEIFDNYVEIIEGLRDHKITPIIQSTMFVAKSWRLSKENNPKVVELNNMLIQYAKENQIEYLDINSLVSNNGYLNEDLSYDGLHLNAKGYKLWKPLVEEVLAKYKL